MKRIFAMLLCAVMLLSLAACGGDKQAKGGKTEKDGELKGEYFDAGEVKVFVPAGWMAFPVTDVFNDGAAKPNALTLIKGATSEMDMYTNPYVRIDFYGEDLEWMGGLEDFYEQKTPVEEMKLGTHTWQGFTTTDYDGVMAVLWSVEDTLEYQVSIQLETEKETISLEDKDVQKILETVAASAS